MDNCVAADHFNVVNNNSTLFSNDFSSTFDDFIDDNYEHLNNTDESFFYNNFLAIKTMDKSNMESGATTTSANTNDNMDITNKSFTEFMEELMNSSDDYYTDLTVLDDDDPWLEEYIATIENDGETKQHNDKVFYEIVPYDDNAEYLEDFRVYTKLLNR